MYLNILPTVLISPKYFPEPQHRMYLNIKKVIQEIEDEVPEPQHCMYLILCIGYIIYKRE